ncbi:MAG: hypothetical protein ABIJ39_00170 [Chloroflexota bacterium]
MPKKCRHKKTNNLARILIVVGVLALAAVVLKGGDNDQPQTTTVSGELPARGGFLSTRP